MSRFLGFARTTVRVAGELMITAGILLFLYVGYSLYWTNVEAQGKARATISDLREQWDRAPDGQPTSGPTKAPTTPVQGNGRTRQPSPGTGIALLYIPRLGDDWVSPVIQGVSKSVLAEGIGHYPRTALPGEVGNFAVAGHRATHGEPFARLDALRRGDSVIVETKDAWFTYRVERSEIVAPTATSVLLPVPGKRGVAPTQKKMTLTTCHPRWGSTSRLIVYTTLAATRPATSGPPPDVSAARST